MREGSQQAIAAAPYFDHFTPENAVTLTGRQSRTMCSPKPFLTTLALFLALPCFSESADYYDETDLLADIPMVSSGSRMRQTPARAPSSVTIIDSDIIRALAPNSLVDVFRLAPSFISFHVNGSLMALSGHDLTDDDPRRVEVRVNGRSVYLPSYPTVAWDSLGITPNDIERIEMVRGSNVPAYGSNAIMGAVNIITKSPLQESGTHVYTTTADRHTRNVNVRSNFKFDKGYGQVRAAHRENSGFNGARAAPDDDQPNSSDQLNDDTRVNHLVFNAVTTPTLLDTFSIEAGFSTGDFGIGDGDRPNEFSDDKNTSYWINAGWERSNDSDRWHAHFAFYDSDSEVNLFRPLSEVLSLAFGVPVSPAATSALLNGNPDPILNFASGRRHAQSLEAELEFETQLHQNLRTLIGAGYKLQRLKAPLEIEGDDFINNNIFYLFSNAEWQLHDQWLLNAGFMFEDQQLDEANFSPRLSLHYQFLPQHTLRLSGSKVFRSPSIIEAKREQFRTAYGILNDYNLLGSDLLNAEEMDQLELAYYGQFFNGALTLDWRAFHENMEGGIDHVKWTRDHQGWDADADFDRDAFFFSNSKDWRATGYDLQVKWSPTDKVAFHLQNTNTRLTTFRLTQEDRPEGSTDADKVPHHVTSLLATYQLPSGWTVAAMAYHQSYVSWRSGKDVDSYDRYDISISKNFTIDRYQLGLNIKVDNLSNAHYEEYQDGNFFERAVYVNANLSW